MVWAPREGLRRRRVQPEYLRAARLEDPAPVPAARREAPPAAAAAVLAAIKTEAGAGPEAPTQPQLALLAELAKAGTAVLEVEAALAVEITPKRAELVVMAAAAAGPGPGAAALEDLAAAAALELAAGRLVLGRGLAAADTPGGAAAPDWGEPSTSGRAPP